MVLDATRRPVVSLSVDPRHVVLRTRRRDAAHTELEVFVCANAAQAWSRARTSVLADLRRNLGPGELARRAPRGDAPTLVGVFNQAAAGAASVVVLPISNVPPALLVSATQP